ncbi:rCG34709, partial [Rattus norvegicus]
MNYYPPLLGKGELENPLHTSMNEQKQGVGRMETTQESLRRSDKDESYHSNNSFSPCGTHNCRCKQKHNAKMRDQPGQDESHGTPTLEKTPV